MSNIALKPLPVSNLVAAQTALAATASSAAFVLPAGDSYMIMLDVSAATGTSPTLSVVLQTSYDGGTNFVDLPIRWASQTAAGKEIMVFRNGLGQNEVAANTAVADTGAALFKNCVFDNFNMKFKYTVGGTNPSYAFTIHAWVLPRGTV